VTKVRLGCAYNPGGVQTDAVVDIGAVSVALDESDGEMQSDPVVAVRPMEGNNVGVVTTSVRRATASLAWGTTAGVLTNIVPMEQVALDASGGRSYTNHCQISGAPPGELYYQITYTDDRGVWAGKVYHVTLPDADDSLRIIGIGDTQSYRALHVLPAVAAAKAPDLVLQVGDITNYCSPDFFPTAADYEHADNNRWEWVRNFGALKPLTAVAPLLTIGGNHDWWNDHDADAFYDRVAVASEIPNTTSVGRSYGRVADFGMARIVALDVWWAVHTGGWAEELAWLRTALDAPDKTWRILMCHYPAYGYPSLGGSFEPLGCRSDVQALCEELGVQLMLSGHTNSPALLNINGKVCHLNVGTPADGGDYRNIFTLCDSTNKPGAGTWIKLHAPTGGSGLQPVTEAVPGYWILDFTANACTAEFRAMSDDSVVYRTILQQPAGLPITR
ncbi:MAG TPA: metallophosphoesterase, partial [Candidatus Cryosericum sp.]|nr:metallophosphoesterase [Candidatus Cryosericum sp.]